MPVKNEINNLNISLKPDNGTLDIRVSNISKEYVVGGISNKVIQDTSLFISEGTFFGLVGPTGCGKTTLLKIIAGFELPTSGEIVVGTNKITAAGPDRGFVFQQPNLFPWLTVFDNVAFSVRYGSNLFRPISKRDINNHVKEYLDTVGLGDCGERYPYQISGGMKARAALARVLAAGTPILLMDEPFAALDAFTRAAMQQLLLKLRDRGICRTLFLITHDIEEAIMVSDSVAVMGRNPGRIVGEVEIPFGISRSYDDVLLSTKSLELKKEILSLLAPYL